jgi:hypothetical protein
MSHFLLLTTALVAGAKFVLINIAQPHLYNNSIRQGLYCPCFINSEAVCGDSCLRLCSQVSVLNPRLPVPRASPQPSRKTAPLITVEITCRTEAVQSISVGVLSIPCPHVLLDTCPWIDLCQRRWYYSLADREIGAKCPVACLGQLINEGLATVTSVSWVSTWVPSGSLV